MVVGLSRPANVASFCRKFSGHMVHPKMTLPHWTLEYLKPARTVSFRAFSKVYQSDFKFSRQNHYFYIYSNKDIKLKISPWIL